MDELSPVPDHVPHDLVRDVDFLSPPGAGDDVHLAWKRVQDESPDFFWTPRNGGHWIATRAEDIWEVQTNHGRFSQRVLTLPVDAEGYKLLPGMVDPPEHGPYRKIIMPAFLPRAIDKLEGSMREVAASLVAEIAPRGECEFIEDFARKLPIATFLKIVDLPYEDREKLLPLVDSMRDGNKDAVRQAMTTMMAYIAGWVDKRRANPGEDLISTVVHSKIGERPIAEDEIFSLLTLIMFGGLDTVTSMLGFVCRFLATNPDRRAELVAHPELHRNAIEELIRRHGVVNTARYITEDFVEKGVQFKAGDLIQIPNALYGLDERINDAPLAVDFRRDSVRHAAFGNGPHTCPGAVLTRRELSAFIQCWLEQIPCFSLKPGSKPRMTSGSVSGVTELRLVWDPTHCSQPALA